MSLITLSLFAKIITKLRESKHQGIFFLRRWQRLTRIAEISQEGLFVDVAAVVAFHFAHRQFAHQKDGDTRFTGGEVGIDVVA